MAYAKIGEYDRAFEVLSILNPIQHSKSNEEVQTYKVEPYVISADIYSHPEHTGRGGWSWYTGASGWFYQAGLEVLGFKRKGNSLKLSPHIPHQWKEYEFNYTYGSSLYKISVENPHQLSSGQVIINLDGSHLSEQVISLADDGAVHEVKVRIENEVVETQSEHV